MILRVFIVNIAEGQDGLDCVHVEYVEFVGVGQRLESELSFSESDKELVEFQLGGVAVERSGGGSTGKEGT